jgi:Domain of unknown function (DUF4194)
VDETHVGVFPAAEADALVNAATMDLGSLVIPMLKGVLYRSVDENRWLALLRREGDLRDYVRVLGLEVIVDEAEGYAFLRTPPFADDADIDGDGALPRLMTRRRLTYGVSLLLALLRKRLAEADAQGGDDRLVMARSEIANLVAVFLTSSTNEAKIADRVDKDIAKIVELGFLQPIGARIRRGEEPSYEVRRILKAFVDAQWMSEFADRLAEYRAGAAESEQPESTSSESVQSGPAQLESAAYEEDERDD